MYNRYYVYNNAVALTAGAPVYSYRVKFRHDYYLFDIGGIESAAQGVNVTLDMQNLTKNRRLMNDPVRSLLCGVQQPGDSSWLHPVLFEKDDVLEVTATLASGAPAASFNLCLFGYHHAGGVPEWCPAPKEVYWYVFDFGNFAANQELVRTIQVVTGKDYELLGWTATTNAAALNTFEFRMQSETNSEEWQNVAVPGECLFPNLAANMRRNRLPIGQRIGSRERITITGRNLTGGVVTDVAVAFYGYHEKREV